MPAVHSSVDVVEILRLRQARHLVGSLNHSGNTGNVSDRANGDGNLPYPCAQASLSIPRVNRSANDGVPVCRASGDRRAVRIALRWESLAISWRAEGLMYILSS